MALPNRPAHPLPGAETALFDLVDVYDRAYESAATTLALTPAQACVLGRLDEQQGMGSLAEELGCDASNITQIVARLEVQGLVVRAANPKDGRARLVSRTARGDQVNDRFNETFSFARSALARLLPEEQLELTKLVRKMLSS